MEQKVEMGPFDQFKVGSGTLCRVSVKILSRALKNLDMNHVLTARFGTAVLKRKVALRIKSWISEVREIAPGPPQGSVFSHVHLNFYTVSIVSNQLKRL